MYFASLMYCRQMHPKDLAKKLEIPNHTLDHRGEDCIKLIKDNSLELGIILGEKNYF